MRKIVYRLKRKRPEISEKRTLLFKQKEFISKNQLDSAESLVAPEITLRICVEIIKTTEMIDSKSGENTIHWISEKLWDNIFSVAIEKWKGGNKNINYLYTLFPFEIDRDYYFNKRGYSRNLDKLIRTLNNNGDDAFDIIIKAKKKVLTESKSRSDKSKYYEIFDRRSINEKFRFDNNSYLHLFKYIALSLSDQIDPKITNLHDSQVYQKRVDYDSDYLSRLSLSQAKKEFNKRVATCIYNFSGGNLQSLSKKERDRHQLLILME